MNVIHLVLFTITIAMTSSVIGVLTYMSIADAQTPTTSDLPSTIGNDSTYDLGLTNESVPVHNTTTTYAAPPQ
jgi:archaellum component FlaG (FlaF/FlaG flagellin family)